MEFIKKDSIISLSNPGVISEQIISPKNSASEKVTITKVHLMPGASQPRHTHEHSEQIWYAIKGKGKLLLCDDKTQDFSEGDAVKVVTLINGEKTVYCGDVDEYSVEHSADKDGNIVLAPGTYDFYYKVAENLIYIGAAEPELPTYDVTVADATVSTTDYSIDLAGTWEERTIIIKLWQDNVQGFGEYAANAETGYTCQLGNPYAELTPTTAGLYADNGDGTFTFTATMTDTDGGIYNISVSGDNPVVEPETKEVEGFTPFAKEEGSLSVAYEAEDWSWLLTLYIENYTGYGTYEVSDVYYGDFTGDYYGMSGSVTIGYDEDAETDVLTATLTTSDGSLIVLVTLYDKAATMPLMITNLRTEQVGAYLQLTGRNDMDDADVMLFLNDYTGEDKAYEVDTENSLMTYGGIELTVLDGSLTKSVDPEYGDMFTGVVNVYAEEEDMNLEIENQMKTFLEDIGYQGFAEFDLKYDYRDQKFKVLEINARQGRSSYYLTPLGHNLVKTLIDDLIYNKEMKYKFLKDKVLLSFVPKGVIKKYIVSDWGCIE